MRKPVIHGRDHAAGGADPIPGGGGGIDFDTVNEGGWLYISTTDGTGSPNGLGIELADVEAIRIWSESTTVIDGASGLTLRSLDGNVSISAPTSGKIVTLSAPRIKLLTLPTSNPGVTGQLWNDAGTVKIA